MIIMNPTEVTNTINAMINNTTSILNSTTQQCSTVANNIQGIYIVCPPAPYQCGDINIHDVDFSQVSQINATCVSNKASDPNIDFKSISSKTADTLSKGLSLGSVAQNTVTTLCENLVNTIVQTYTQSCTVDSLDDQSIKIYGRAGNINITLVKNDQYIKSFNKCTMTSKSVIDAKKQLYQALNIPMPQENTDGDGSGDGSGSNSGNGTAIMQFIQNYGFFIFMGIVILSGLVFTKMTILQSPFFIPGIAIITAIYLMVQYFTLQDWPYDTTDDNINKKIFLGACVSLGIGVFLFLIILFFHKRNHSSS